MTPAAPNSRSDLFLSLEIMSQRRLRSFAKQRIKGQHACPCKRQLIPVKCTLCGYSSCKCCVWKRFDISSERKYKNIIKNFVCSHCTYPSKKRRTFDSNTREYVETIDDVLVDDVLLIILSFAPYSMRGTNKNLTKLDVEREKVTMLKIYDSFLSNQDVETIIVDKKREKLHKIEEKFGFLAIRNTLKSALGLCESLSSNGRIRILIHCGMYGEEIFFSNKHDKIELIGIGNVEICDFTSNVWGGRIKMNNLTLNGTAYVQFGSLQMKNCKIIGSASWKSGIFVSMGDLKVENCTIVNESSISIGICLSMHANVSVCCSRFVNLDRSIFIDAGKTVYSENEPRFGLKCVDCIFENSGGVSTYHQMDEAVMKWVNQSVLRGNVFCERNADANKVDFTYLN